MLLRAVAGVSGSILSTSEIRESMLSGIENACSKQSFAIVGGIGEVKYAPLETIKRGTER
jgi:hypothetical protein